MFIFYNNVLVFIFQDLDTPFGHIFAAVYLSLSTTTQRGEHAQLRAFRIPNLGVLTGDAYFFAII